LAYGKATVAAKHNITVAIDPALLKKARAVAARRHRAVEKLLATPVSRSTAREVVTSYGAWVREPTNSATVMRAIDIAEMAQLMFWDALIVASAEEMQATHIYSEDLNAGQTIAGVKVVNPLAEA